MRLPTEDKDRKALPLWTFLIEYFPDTFLAVANVAIKGNEQHNPGQPLHWDREKSKDQMNTAFRHQFDHGRGVRRDTDGQYHLAKAIWRLSAELQLLIEAEERESSQDGPAAGGVSDVDLESDDPVARDGMRRYFATGPSGRTCGNILADTRPKHWTD